jgi:tRNA 2-thiouridine synthesizing protein A
MPHSDLTLDAGKTACGDLVLLIVREMCLMTHGQVLHIVGYDRGALEDIPAWCRMTGNTLIHQDIATDASQPSHFYIQKG